MCNVPGLTVSATVFRDKLLGDGKTLAYIAKQAICSGCQDHEASAEVEDYLCKCHCGTVNTRIDERV